jgi:uncharacterized protein (UPF0332 family)
MRLRQIQAEWQRAQQALQAANLLQTHGLAADAISRAYYATMHAAKAALLAQDVMAESHAAVRRLFGQVLVQTGEIERKWAAVLARAHDRRAIADYSIDTVFSPEDTGQLVHDAHRFLERIAHYLTSKDIVLEQSEERPPA